MRGNGKLKSRAIPGGNHEEAASHLRNAVVRCVEHRDAGAIARAMLGIDAVEFSLDQPQPFVLAAKAEPFDILQEKRSGPSALEDAHIGAQRARASGSSEAGSRAGGRSD